MILPSFLARVLFASVARASTFSRRKYGGVGAEVSPGRDSEDELVEGNAEVVREHDEFFHVGNGFAQLAF